MDSVSDKHIRDFVAASHRVAEHGLVRCGSGNLSWRVDNELMLISASGAWLGEMAEDRVVVARITDAAVLNDRKPSVEIAFHAGILRERRDVNVVLHFQTPCATAIACHDPASVDYFVIPEIPYYIGDIASVPYKTPGTPELAGAVVAAARDHDMVMLCNHGQLTVGKDFDDTIQKAVLFELACEIIVRGQSRPQTIPADDVARLYARAGSGGQGAGEEKHRTPM